MIIIVVLNSCDQYIYRLTSEPISVTQDEPIWTPTSRDPATPTATFFSPTLTKVPTRVVTATLTPTIVIPSPASFKPLGLIYFVTDNSSIHVIDLNISGVIQPKSLSSVIENYPTLLSSGDYYYLSSSPEEYGRLDILHENTSGNTIRLASGGRQITSLVGCESTNSIIFIDDQFYKNGKNFIYMIRPGKNYDNDPILLYKTTKIIANVKCSPDGSGLGILLEGDDPNYFHLEVLNINSKEMIFSDFQTSIHDFDWTNDGKYILISENDNKQDYIVTYSLPDFSSRKIIKIGKDESVFNIISAPFPHLLLAEIINGDRHYLSLIDITTETEAVLIEKTIETNFYPFYPTWSPDGDFIAFSDHDNIRNYPQLSILELATKYIISVDILNSSMITLIRW